MAGWLEWQKERDVHSLYQKWPSIVIKKSTDHKHFNCAQLRCYLQKVRANRLKSYIGVQKKTSLNSVERISR